MPLAFMKEGMSNRRVAGLLFLEAAVIFLGITSSFWIEEWRQNREDLDTYHHLLEEIYYNAVLDEAAVPLGIAANNLALKDALELTVLGSSELADDELFGRLDHIFVSSDWYRGSFNPAGYVRLSNTSLSIPFDETLLSLDNLFQSLDGLQSSLRSVGDQIGELGARHWRVEGLISCTGAASNDGTTILMDRPYMAEIRTLMYPGGECISELENQARASELLARPDFQNALRQVIDLQQDIAWLLGLHQEALRDLKTVIENRLPDVSLPVVSVELMSWPMVTTAETERQTPMRQNGPHTWEATAELTDGFIKFRANEDWAINWGAPFPDMIDSPGFLWNSDRVRIEDVFPSGTAAFNGMNLPVRAGTYRVTFNSQTFEYELTELKGS
jgi:hypothetical protein